MTYFEILYIVIMIIGLVIEIGHKKITAVVDGSTVIF